MVPILTPCPVTAADWEYYSEDKNGDLLYYDKTIPVPENGVVRVFQKKVYTSDSLFRVREKLGKKYHNLSEVISLIEIHCPTKRSQVKSITHYNADGSILSEETYEDRLDWRSIPANSDQQILYRLCCPRSKK